MHVRMITTSLRCRKQTFRFATLTNVDFSEVDFSEHAVARRPAAGFERTPDGLASNPIHAGYGCRRSANVAQVVFRAVERFRYIVTNGKFIVINGS